MMLIVMPDDAPAILRNPYADASAVDDPKPRTATMTMTIPRSPFFLEMCWFLRTLPHN